MREVYGIAAFRSRQQVLHFEDALRREGLNVGIVTTPRAVAMGCGLSVRFDIEDADRVKRALRRISTGSLIGLYRVEYGGVRPVITPIGR